MDDRAGLGHGGGDRLDRRHADRTGGVSGAEHDGRRAAVRICRRRARRTDQSVRCCHRRLFGRHLRKSSRDLHPRRRQRTETADRAGADHHRIGRQTGWPVWPAHREASLIMSAIQEVVTQAPAIEAVPKRAMTLGYGASLAMLALLIVVPLFVKNFIIFQLTMLLIYGLAVLALNILTGGSGQFSLGQSAFYAVGAYTSAILMEHANINYALTLPIAGIICFAFGFLFGQPALRLSGVYLALATFALATAMPQLLKLGYFEHWTGGVQWLPGSIVGSAFIIFVPNIAEGISKGLSGAVFGVLLFLVIFLVPHGARQVAIVAQQLIGKLKKN